MGPASRQAFGEGLVADEDGGGEGALGGEPAALIWA